MVPLFERRTAGGIASSARGQETGAQERTLMDTLLEVALAARERAHAPYSHFKVGAAVRDENGRLFAGCNIESASYGLSICAERVAVFKALSEGAARLVRIIVVVDSGILTPPCGACRQVLWEFCRDAELLLANLAGQEEATTVRQIFPKPFDASFL
jgi:cytidine deaminase